jgi:telomerase Cajal body protein 1
LVLDLKCRLFPPTSSFSSSTDTEKPRTYLHHVLSRPPNLLDDSGVHRLEPYSSEQLPGPAYATSIFPGFQLADPASTLYLTSVPDLPTRLYSIYNQGPIASFPFINPETEEYLAPHSLCFDSNPSSACRFYAGSNCAIGVFDCTRNGEGPLATIKTIPSRRKKIVGGGVGMKGIISALNISQQGILAAGTFTRWIGLYDQRNATGTVGVFQLCSTDKEQPSDFRGAGATQTLWTECGRYLCVAERASDGIHIWDVRVTGRRLSWLSGREAQTMQRMTFDLLGDRLIAGGTDGRVRSWSAIGKHDGPQPPDGEFEAHGGSTLHSALIYMLVVLLTR